jgi:hypothetical protein
VTVHLRLYERVRRPRICSPSLALQCDMFYVDPVNHAALSAHTHVGFLGFKHRGSRCLLGTPGPHMLVSTNRLPSLFLRGALLPRPHIACGAAAAAADARRHVGAVRTVQEE